MRNLESVVGNLQQLWQSAPKPVDIDRPDLQHYPDFAQVKVLDVVVEPGETMFLPLGWRHHVAALDLSLSFSFSNPAVPNGFSYRNLDVRNR